MLEILSFVGGIFRSLCILLDSIAFSLIDNAYNLIVAFSKATFFNGEIVTTIRNNVYVIIGIFALFRLALLLVNSMINPDKLTEKGSGITNILANLIIMFVLLIATPFLFNEALDLQQKIVEGNYVQKIFLNTGELKNAKNPGKIMRSIAIESLVTLNEDINMDKCDNECKEAVEAYNKMKEDEFSIPTLAKYIGVESELNADENGDTEKGYVYNYTMIVTFIVGWFITYVLFSFAIDIAVRMVELTVLQILAPLFIVTYIDPKSSKSGPFKKWLTVVGKTYASLFIKLAIVSIMLLLISLIDNFEIPDAGAFGNLILLLAILIFAKKAPKWIGDMLGVEGGMDGLGITKKLSEAALAGGAISKASNVAKGIGLGALNNARTLRKANKANQKKDGTSAWERAKRNAQNENGLINKFKAGAGTYFKPDEIKKNSNNFGQTASAGGKGLFAGMVKGAKMGIEAKDIKDLTAKLKQDSKNTLNAVGHTSVIGRVADKIKDKSDKLEQSVIGTQLAQDMRKKNEENKKLAEAMLGKKLFMDEKGDLFDADFSHVPPTALKAFKDEHRVAFDVKSMKQKFGGNTNGISDVVASMITDEKNSHFTTKTINAQTYKDEHGNIFTTAQIAQGTLVKDKVDAHGNVIYDVNGNVVKEAYVDRNGRSYSIGDRDVKDAIKTYTNAADDKTGSTGANISINGKELNLTGQGVLEYEAAFAAIKDENANSYIETNNKKSQITQQVAELQANYATAESNLNSLLLNTAYGKAEQRKLNLEEQKKNVIDTINEFHSMISEIDRDISSAETQLNDPNVSPDIKQRLNIFIASKKREKENLKLETSKMEANDKALENAISACDSIMQDSTNRNEYAVKSQEKINKLSAMKAKIKELQDSSFDITKELGQFMSYGTDITTKIAGVTEALNTSNSRRFLAETDNQKTKARKNADTFKKEKGQGDNK